MNDNEYNELNSVISEMGLTKQTLFDIFTKVVIRERKIPFTIEAPADSFYSEANMNRLRESIAQGKAGHIVTKSMEDLEDLAK